MNLKQVQYNWVQHRIPCWHECAILAWDFLFRMIRFVQQRCTKQQTEPKTKKNHVIRLTRVRSLLRRLVRVMLWVQSIILLMADFLLIWVTDVRFVFALLV